MSRLSHTAFAFILLLGPIGLHANEPDMESKIAVIQALVDLTDIADEEQRKAVHSAFQELIDNHPEDPAPLIAYGQFHKRLGDDPKARQLWLEALNLSQDDHSILALLGEDHLEQRQIKPAAKYFLRAIESHPDHPYYHYQLANLLFLFRNDLYEIADAESPGECMALAMDHFKTARDLEPQNTMLAQAYAESFYLLDPPQWQKAFEAWQNVEKIGTDDNPTYVHLARVSIHLGHQQQALDYLARVDSPRLAILVRKLTAKANRLDADASE